MAARARHMAKLAYREDDKTTLRSIAEDYERLAAAIEAQSDAKANQEE
jgi:hypothetical protein